MLRKYLPYPLRSPDAAAPAGGGSPGVGPAAAPLSPLHELAQMLSEESSPGTNENQDAPPSPAEGDPANPPPQAATDQPGQDNLSPETPKETPEGETPTGEPETVLPESENAELTQAIAALSPTERKSALELVKALQPGEIPRIAKLISKQHAAEQTIEAQAKQIEELEAAKETTDHGPRTTSLPASVAKLKTVQDVQARQEVVENNADALQDFLDANPGVADTPYTIEGKEFTRQQLIDRRAEFRAELKALPKRSQQLTQHAQFTQARTQAHAQIVKDFPELQDPENPDAKMAMQLLKTPKFSDEANADYLALALARGHRELQAELAARKGNGKGSNGKSSLLTPGTPHLTRQAAGKVPLGKPHAPVGTTAPARANGEANVKAALEDHGKNSSRSSLAAVISAAGL